MTKKLLAKTILLWLLLVALAVVNGTIRTFGYKPFVGDLVAHQISTFTFIAMLFAVSYVAFRKQAEEISGKTFLWIGAIWLVCTEAFEFLAGHYLFGHSWAKLFADYDIFAGRLWILVLFATFFSPYLVWKIKGGKNITVYPDGTVFFLGKQYRCALGKSGFSKDPREGDNATPVGSFLMRKVFYRPDKFERAPVTVLPVIALTPADGWSDDVSLPDYNTFVKLPYVGSHEELWRTDDVYDLIIPLGFNDDPPISGVGSAIFMHVARENYTPTRGCIALSRGDLLEILAKVEISTKVCIIGS